MIRHARIFVVTLTAAATVVAATAALGSTRTAQVGGDPLCNPNLCELIHEVEAMVPPTEMADWAGTLTEYPHRDYQHQVTIYQVHAYSTSCSDAGVDTTDYTGATCTADVQANFEITTEQQGDKSVKVCTPYLNPQGFNAVETFTDSVGNAYPPVSGLAYLSATYTDDQPLPAKAEAHFHFEGTKEDAGATNVLEESSTAIGLLACSSLASKLPPVSTGHVYATHS